MSEKLYKKAQAFIMAFCALSALLMLLDFSVPGKPFMEEVVSVNKSFEKYYNAGGNFHYSFKIKTENYVFPASESFASLAPEGQELQIKVSPIFKEVNSAEVIKNGYKEFYSLRVLSGLFLPALVLLILAIGYRYGEKVSTFVFVIEVLTIANLIFLLN